MKGSKLIGMECGLIVIIVLKNRELMEYLIRVASKLSKFMWVSK
jgi:hypothetical protein